MGIGGNGTPRFPGGSDPKSLGASQPPHGRRRTSHCSGLTSPRARPLQAKASSRPLRIVCTLRSLAREGAALSGHGPSAWETKAIAATTPAGLEADQPTLAPEPLRYSPVPRASSGAFDGPGD
eukprot:scaffold149_cov315-Pinguiococcus_pyrenoidosus.AAC.126